MRFGDPCGFSQLDVSIIVWIQTIERRGDPTPQRDVEIGQLVLSERRGVVETLGDNLTTALTVSGELRLDDGPGDLAGPPVGLDDVTGAAGRAGVVAGGSW